MDNYTIADNFSLLAKLMDIHGENSFKTKSYSSASFAIEKNSWFNWQACQKIKSFPLKE